MTPKVLLVGIDGVDFDRFQRLIDGDKRWHYHKAYTGGIVGTASEAGTWSGPGWSTVLTGTWSNKHLVVNNASSQRAHPHYPWILQRLKRHSPSWDLCSIVTWLPIHAFFAEQMAGIDKYEYHEDDKKALDKAKEVIAHKAPAATFVHLGDPDLVGHSHGFGARYDAALETAFGQLQELSDAVRQRQAQHPAENWLILVTTDHGRTANGYGHGGQSIGEKTIFIASSRPPNAELATVEPIPGLDPLYGHASQAGLAPTIMRHMGMSRTDDAWGMDSIPLTGALGVRKLRLEAPGTLRWASSGSGSIDILRNGVHVTTLPANTTSWTDTNGSPPAASYAVIKNDTTAALLNNHIQTVLDWNTERLFFFFSNGTYSRFNRIKDSTDPGYPAPVREGNWPGLWRYRDKMIASFSWTDRYAMVFLNDGNYIRYDKTNESMNGYPKPINEQTWRGLAAYACEIKTAVRWKNEKVFFFLKNNTYIRYDIATDRVDPGYPQDVNEQSWPGVARHSEKLVCAVRDGTRNFAYFFLSDATYLKYNMDNEGVSPYYPAPIKGNWKGLL